MENSYQKYNIGEIYKLIKLGYDIELISYELDIPLEYLKQLNKESENSRKNIQQRTNTKKSKFDTMQEKYFSLYKETYKKTVIEDDEITKEEKELTNSIINRLREEITSTVNEIQEKDLQTIEGYLKKIICYRLTLEQYEELNEILEIVEIEKVKVKKGSTIKKTVFQLYNSIALKYVEEVDKMAQKAEDVEELKEFNRKILEYTKKVNSIRVASVKTKIDNKIMNIKNRKAANKIRNNVSKEIKNLVHGMTEGTINTQQMQECINMEAEKWLEEKKKTGLKTTIEQQKKQVLMQIKIMLEEQAEVYSINNPEKMVLDLQELYENKKDQTAIVVINNLIKNKRFEEAKKYAKCL